MINGIYCTIDLNEWQSVRALQADGSRTTHTRPTGRLNIVAFARMRHRRWINLQPNEGGYIYTWEDRKSHEMNEPKVCGGCRRSTFSICIKFLFFAVVSFPMSFHLKRCAQIQIIKLSNLSLVLCVATENTQNASSSMIFMCGGRQKILSLSLSLSFFFLSSWSRFARRLSLNLIASQLLLLQLQ